MGEYRLEEPLWLMGVCTLEEPVLLMGVCRLEEPLLLMGECKQVVGELWEGDMSVVELAVV